MEEDSPKTDIPAKTAIKTTTVIGLDTVKKNNEKIIPQQPGLAHPTLTSLTNSDESGYQNKFLTRYTEEKFHR